MAYKMFSKQGALPIQERTLSLSSFNYTDNVLKVIFKGTGGSREKQIKGQLGGAVSIWHLPLPSVINDTTAVEWENTGLTAMTAGGVSKLGSAVSEGSAVAKAMNGLSKSVLTAVKKGGSVEGKVMNPNSYLAFKGNAPRDLMLTFTFIPNDIGEAKQIEEGIIALKRDMSPNRDSIIILGAPNIFSIKFGSENSFLNNMIGFDLCVLKDMKINFGQDGHLAMFEEGGQLYPKQTTLTLNFAEFTSKTVEEWAQRLSMVK